MGDNLPELRDIHLPEGVSMFPPAYGWWVILALIIAAFLLYELVLFIRSKSKKLFALQLLKNIDTGNVISDAVKISEILRRICVYKYKSAVTLFDKEWIDFLNFHAKKKIEGKPAELLANAPYISKKTQKYSKEDVEEVRDFARLWIGDNL